MDIKSKDRDTLKSYFRKNLVPTQGNFADLIDGLLNQKDDGIVKLPGDPLSIEAQGEPAGPQKLINFYHNLAEPNPAWTLQLNPRSDPDKPATAKPGFSIGDGQGTSRLFIEQATGNLGIGTLSPTGRLDVAGLVRIGLDEGGTGDRSICFVRDTDDEINAGKIVYKGWSGDSMDIVGAGPSGARKTRFFDNVEISAALQVNGALNPSVGNGDSNGIVFPKSSADPNDAAWLRFYPKTKDNSVLEIGISNDPDDHIALMPSGNVGIGLSNPKARLQIQGNAAAAVSLMVDTGGGAGKSLWLEHRGSNFIVRPLSDGSTSSVVENTASGGLLINPAAGNVGVGTTDPKAKLDVTGTANINNGNGYAVKNKFMANGSLTLGGADQNYGGGNGWNANTAALLLETKNNTEIAVHDAGTRVASLMYYEGGTVNRLTLGREMGSGFGWGIISEVAIPGLLRVSSSKTQPTKDSQGVPAATSGIRFQDNPGGGGFDAAWIQYYARIGESCTLEIGIANDADDWIDFVASGGVKVKGAVVLSSDENAKKDIEALNYGLAEVMKLRPVAFNWKAQANRHKTLGLIAQDVQAVIGEVVYSQDGGEMGISYMNLIPVLINAIKELEEKLGRLEAQAVTG